MLPMLEAGVHVHGHVVQNICAVVGVMGVRVNVCAIQSEIEDGERRGTRNGVGDQVIDVDSLSRKHDGNVCNRPAIVISGIVPGPVMHSTDVDHPGRGRAGFDSATCAGRSLDPAVIGLVLWQYAGMTVSEFVIYRSIDECGESCQSCRK